jgi:hypothetical protein
LSLGDAVLSRNRHRDDLHVDLLHAVADRPDHRQSRAARRRLDPAEPEHDALLELLHHPDRTASRDHAQHDKYRDYDQDGFNHCQQPFSGDARPVRPGPSAESQARPLPATLSVNTHHGRRKFWCAATDDLQARAPRTPAGRVRGRASSPATGGRQHRQRRRCAGSVHGRVRPGR